MLHKLWKFVDERTGLGDALRVALDEPIPGGARWAYVFGSVLTLLFVAQAVTGLALMTVYAPSAQTAWASVYYLTHRLSWGGLARGVHHYGAQAMVVVLGLHLLQVALYGAYKRPREFNWWIGLGLLGVTLGFALTGYLLPWDQKGYWATRVATNIAGTTPVVGAWLQRFLQGGGEYGHLTLTRFYALHVGVLPASLLALLGLHLALFRRHGVTPPAGTPDVRELAAGEGETHALSHDIAAVEARAAARGVKVDRFWPTQILFDGLAALAVLAGVLYLAKYHGAPLDAPADPASNYPARPEWYFLPLFELLKYFHGPLEVVGTMVLPGLAVGYLVALPLLDRKAGRALRPRLALVAPLFAGLLAAGGLVGLATRSDAGDAGFQRARAAATRQAARAAVLARGGIPVEGPLEMVRNDPEVRPGELYAQHCATCHTPANVTENAKGPALEGFGSRAWARGFVAWPAAPHFMGRTEIDEMPSQLRRVGGEEGLAAVAEYLHAQGVERGDPPADAALVARGSEIYHRRCTTCHLGAGDTSGTDPADRNAPDLDGWGSRAWIRSQIVEPASPARYGDRNHMPSFREELTPRDLEMVVDHVRALRSRPAPPYLPPPARTPPPAAAGDAGSAGDAAAAPAGDGG